MATTSNALRHLRRSKHVVCEFRRGISTTDDIVREGDIVLLRRVKKPPILTKPLKAGHTLGTHFGTIKHDDILGKSYRDTVSSSKAKYARIHRPTLGEYATLTPRIVTPVYPADAQLIVSLLDIHVDPARPEDASEQGPSLEILEAGTGHGSLTLHLARAMHAANSPSPALPQVGPPPIVDAEGQSQDQPADPTSAEYDAWRKTRRAVVHTLDISREHSLAARKVVRGFRQGIYAGNVDFNVGSIDHFIDSECQRRGVAGKVFHHILLDLPGVHEYITKAAQGLKPDGTLIVFCPSVTQIAQCVEMIRKQKLPLSYQEVIELGAGYGGGKQWDVRLSRARKPKSARDPKPDEAAVVESDEAAVVKSDEAVAPLGSFGFLRRLFGGATPKASATTQRAGDVVEDEKWFTVCRPSVGHRVVGGGFVGVWRRKKDWEKFDEEDESAE